MDAPSNEMKSQLRKQLRGIIIILVVLVLNAAITLLVLTNRTYTISETDKLELKNDIVEEVKRLIKSENGGGEGNGDGHGGGNPSQICLEGAEDCNDTPDSGDQGLDLQTGSGSDSTDNDDTLD